MKKGENIFKLKDVANALEKKISDYKKIPDAGERLLAFKALKESCEDSYNSEQAANDKYRQERRRSNGMFNGLMLGGFASAFGGFTAMCLITTGVGIPLGLAIMAGGTGASVLGGRKLGGFGFGGEKKQAIRIYKMNLEIDAAIKSLTALENPANIDALLRSPLLEKVTQEFPNLAGQFNAHAERMEAREKIVGKTVPAADSTANKNGGPVL